MNIQSNRFNPTNDSLFVEFDKNYKKQILKEAHKLRMGYHHVYQINNRLYDSFLEEDMCSYIEEDMSTYIEEEDKHFYDAISDDWFKEEFGRKWKSMKLKMYEVCKVILQTPKDENGFISLTGKMLYKAGVSNTEKTEGNRSILKWKKYLQDSYILIITDASYSSDIGYCQKFSVCVPIIINTFKEIESEIENKYQNSNNSVSNNQSNQSNININTIIKHNDVLFASKEYPFIDKITLKDFFKSYKLPVNANTVQFESDMNQKFLGLTKSTQDKIEWINSHSSEINQIRFMPKYEWTENKSPKTKAVVSKTVKVSIRSYTPMCSTYNDLEHTVRNVSQIQRRSFYARKMNHYDIHSAIHQVNRLLNAGTWNDIEDIYKAVISDTGLKLNRDAVKSIGQRVFFDKSADKAWIDYKNIRNLDYALASKDKASIKYTQYDYYKLAAHRYSLNYKERNVLRKYENCEMRKDNKAYFEFNRISDVSSKNVTYYKDSIIDEETFKIIYNSFLKIENGQFHSKDIFLWESLIEINTLYDLKQKDIKTFNVFDAFYSNLSTEEIVQTLADNANKISQCYKEN